MSKDKKKQPETFDEVIEFMYEQEIAALRVAAEDGYTQQHKSEMRGLARGWSRARAEMQRLRSDGYTIAT